jgi:homoserine dehydrogenase
VADLDITTPRSFSIPSELLTTDVKEIIENPDIDIVVEAIGGIKPALDFILTSLKNKKYVVTPNKEVIAKRSANNENGL